MNEKEVERYMIASKIISIPEVQKRFGLGYKEVHTYFTKLVREEKLCLKNELHYEYNNRVENIPPIYLKVLWDCIMRDDVDFDYIKMKFDLSNPTIRIMLKWMRDNEFIENSPIPDVLLSKEEFIERFGSLEEEDEEEEEIIVARKDSLKELRGSLEQKRRELLKRMDDLTEEKKEESDEADAIENLELKPDVYSLGLELLNDEEIKEKIKAVIQLNPKMTLEDYLGYVESKHITAIARELKEREIYEKILNVLSQFEEGDFQDFKEVLLS